MWQLFLAEVLFPMERVLIGTVKVSDANFFLDRAKIDWKYKRLDTMRLVGKK